jgi:hypothetical protein
MKSNEKNPPSRGRKKKGSPVTEDWQVFAFLRMIAALIF